MSRLLHHAIQGFVLGAILVPLAVLLCDFNDPEALNWPLIIALGGVQGVVLMGVHKLLTYKE